MRHDIPHTRGHRFLLLLKLDRERSQQPDGRAPRRRGRWGDRVGPRVWGEGGSHPSNILDNGYAFGTISVNGDMPVIVTRVGLDMAG